MTDKFLKQVNGVLTETVPLATSAGAADAGKIPMTDASGRLDPSIMPVGTGGDVTELIVAFEALAAGDFVNVFTDSGTAKLRKADATTAGKDADGFVLSAVAAGAVGTMHVEGSNTQCIGLTVGATHFLATTPGLSASTPPASAGNIVQRLGKAKTATELIFVPARPITLA